MFADYFFLINSISFLNYRENMAVRFRMPIKDDHIIQLASIDLIALAE